MLPVILVRRTWLLWGLLLVAWQLGATWAVDRWSSWEWVRAAAPVLAWVVCVGVALWGIASMAVFTRRGFWIPFEGRGRWQDVVARDALTVTLRVSQRYGMDRVVSFDRVGEWPATARILDARLPSHLPGLQATEPHQRWRQELSERADDLIRRISRQVTPPACVRTWLSPGEDDYVHRLQLVFEPSAADDAVEVRLGDGWFPDVRVGGCYAYVPETEFEGDDADEVESADDALIEAAAVLVAVFRGVSREPVKAWRISDHRGKSWDFFPRPQF